MKGFAMAETAEEFLAKREAQRGAASASTCANPECRTALHETSTGNRWTADGCVCSDCYYEPLSDTIEAAPIRTAGIRRG
jgi:hypothetical protein